MKEIRTIRGVIAEVMESWPLQLVIQSDEVRTHVALTFQTSITKNGKSVASSELRVWQSVEIEGIPTATDALTANSIEVLKV